MHSFGIWYFETGWLFATAITAALGWFSSSMRQPWMMVFAILGALIVSAIAAFGKYGI